MIHGSLLLHNTVELDPGLSGGVILRRFPRAIRESLGPLGRLVSQESAGCEIRFVTEAENIRIALSCQTFALAPYERHNLDLFVYRGAFLHSHHALEPGRINYIPLMDIGGGSRRAFLGLKSELRDTEYFSHNVWRILCGRYGATLHEVDTFGYPVRPPNADELPRRRMLCYGSSITNGASPNLHHLSYIYGAARHLRCDVLNQGLSGSCRIEPAVADYLAGRGDWDFITLELGVNMRGDVSPADFRQRVVYLLDALAARHPQKPVVLISIFPNSQSRGVSASAGDVQETQCAFDRILRELALASGRSKISFVDGADVLCDPSGLSPDLIHPSDHGHIEMGRHLADRLRSLDL